MYDHSDLEEANKEVEKSKAILHSAENSDTEKNNESKDDEVDKTEAQGSGIFTVDGKELPKIDGGYDIINPGGTLADDDFVSV